MTIASTVSNFRGINHRLIGRTLFLDPGGDSGTGGNNDEDSKDEKPKPKSFTQDEVNRISASERRAAEKERDAKAAKLKALMEKLEIDDEDSIEEKLEELRQAAVKPDPKPNKDEDLARQQREAEEFRKKLEKAEQKVHDQYKPQLERLGALEKRVLKADILTAATQVGAYKEQDFVDKLLPFVKYDADSDEIVVVDEKGEIRKSDKMLPLTVAEAVAIVAEENPHLVRASGLPGSGGGSQQRAPVASGNIDFSKMTMKEYEAWRKANN